MSEFYDEVDEEVRREQLKRLLDRYSIFIIAIAVLIIAGVGGWRGYQYAEGKKAAEAGSAFNKAIELSEQNKREEAEKAFAEVAATAPAGYRMLARFHQAAEAAGRDKAAAVKLYDELAADRSIGAEQQSMARLRAAGLLVDTAPYPDLKQRLEGEAASGAPFRHAARELLALSAWKANDAAAARQWLDMIALDGETPPGLRSRAEALQALLPAVAKS
ncbi:tetratricopeptide repeat protein [Bradyrhizobium sp.]|uniref:tetratricopeptide repeat protein n=1 Tax=Bradyrhizobium sp. TaxID=376 RepID=UPI00290DA54C|nr:tetratricopeptide repeat protein [Bradyrhizobium sp.]MDU6489054.1 tetratricopeptide repeat protein [Bradyrhizobium sp.]